MNKNQKIGICLILLAIIIFVSSHVASLNVLNEIEHLRTELGYLKYYSSYEALQKLDVMGDKMVSLENTLNIIALFFFFSYAIAVAGVIMFVYGFYKKRKKSKEKTEEV